MGEEKCCCCLPLDCGVKTLAVLTMIGTVFVIFNAIALPELRALYLPAGIAQAILCYFWLAAWCSPSEGTKKAVSLAWLVLAVVFGTALKLYNIVSGKMGDYSCSEAVLSEHNEFAASVNMPSLTEEECRAQQGGWLWGDLVFALLINLYFLSVIIRWSKQSDGYEAI